MARFERPNAVDRRRSHRRGRALRVGMLWALPLGAFAAWLLVWWIGAIAISSPTSSAAANSYCGQRLVHSDAACVERTLSVRVLIAFDDEWREAWGEAAEAKARLVTTRASALFRGVGIHLLPVRVVAWDSPDQLTTGPSLSYSLRSSVEWNEDEFDLALMFTGQHLDGGKDGWARSRTNEVLVRRHPGRLDRDATVLAHEVAHVFGAAHACDVPGRRGLMADSGFDDVALVCPCTRVVLESNLGRFAEEAG